MATDETTGLAEASAAPVTLSRQTEPRLRIVTSSTIRSTARGFHGTVVVRILLSLGLGVSTIMAYRYSLSLVISWLHEGMPLDASAIALFVAPSLALIRVLTPIKNHDIKDRDVDYIIGLPLLLTALGMNSILPIVDSTQFWHWRLDLLSLPLFVAGSVCLVFGVRAAWHFRISILILLAAWPVPYLALIGDGRLRPLGLSLGWILLAGAVIIAALGLPGSWQKESFSGISGRHVSIAGAFRSVRLPAIVIIAAAAVLLSVVGSGYPMSAAIMSGTGSPRIDASSVVGADVPGWSIDPDPQGGGVAGAGTSESTNGIRYRAAQKDGSASTGPAASVLVRLSSQGPAGGNGVVVAPPLALRSSSVKMRFVDLGYGVIGLLSAESSRGATTMSSLSWRWQVRDGRRTVEQQIVISLGSGGFAPISKPPQDGDLMPARLAIADWLNGYNAGFDSRDNAASNVLISFARGLVTSVTERAGAGSS